MAKRKKISWLLCFFAFVLGIAGGFVGLNVVFAPQTDELSVWEEVVDLPAADSNVDLEKYNSEFSVHFLELGNKYTGDCTYIKTDTVDILIDCGSKTSSLPTITNYLSKYVTDGILEYVIVTHAHTDHFAGFATASAKTKSIFETYECQTIIDFSQTNDDTRRIYQTYIQEREAEIAQGATHLTAAQCVEQGKTVFEVGTNVTMTILNSTFYTQKATKENDYSVCTLFTHRGRNFLFTGDLEATGEKELVRLNPTLPQVELYKAGHHGSSTSSCPELMEVVKPKRVCVCCCAGSSEYSDDPAAQFPTQKFIDNICEYVSEIYVTTLCLDYKNNKFQSFNGNIVCISSEKGIVTICSSNNISLQNTDWFKKNRVWNKA